jgi:DNA-directed RNA polymerase subunit RPC12/RpoP
MEEEMGDVEVRCRSCHYRFVASALQEQIACPNCSQKWRLKWFDETTATILAPESWVEFQKKMKEINK